MGKFSIYTVYLTVMKLVHKLLVYHSVFFWVNR